MKHIGAVLSGLVVVLAARFSGQAEAAIYQCREGGRMTYQALPCTGQSADLGLKGRRGHGQALDEAQALADELWTGLTAGMPMAAVRGAMPELTQVARSRMRRFESGAIALLEKKVVVAGENFLAQYLFLNGGFHQVWLSQLPSSQPDAASKQAFAKVARLLARLWGDAPRENSPVQVTPGEGLFGARFWVDAEGYAQGWVLVKAASQQEGHSQLTFGYWPKGAQDYEQLRAGRREGGRLVVGNE